MIVLLVSMNQEWAKQKKYIYRILRRERYLPSIYLGLVRIFSPISDQFCTTKTGIFKYHNMFTHIIIIRFWIKCAVRCYSTIDVCIQIITTHSSNILMSSQHQTELVCFHPSLLILRRLQPAITKAGMQGTMPCLSPNEATIITGNIPRGWSISRAQTWGGIALLLPLPELTLLTNAPKFAPLQFCPPQNYGSVL